MPVHVIYFSDVLCVWAYVGDARLTELRAQFGDDVEIEHRFCSVFGDTAGKVGGGWKDRGGYEAFAAHVHEVAARFDVSLHSDLWRTVRPASSDSPHLFVKACQLLEASGEVDAGASDRLLASLREAFFQDGKDIARRDVHLELARAQDLPLASLERELHSGTAHAALAADAQARECWHIRGSPTYVLNEGRQKLYGNVGYRVIEANVRELLREPNAGEASWC